MEHSRLLKFLVPGRSHSTEMAETPSFKVQYEYQNPENVESEVPGSQNIREITDKPHDESIDGAEIQNGGYTITRSYTEQSATVEGTTITRTTVTLSTNSTSGELVKEEKTEVSSERMEAEDSRPKTKIPKLKFRQAAERVKRERRLTRGLTEHETHIPVPSTPTNKLSRHSKIPPPTSKPVVHKRDGEEESFRPDEEFDKIYEEIVENTQTEIEVKHPEIIESKFEEIIHDYDENKIQPINVEKLRQSRIPSLRRRTSEQADSKTVVISEKTKSRSLPRLKEISMRVKEDEGLGPVKYSRTVSTENTRGGGQKSVVETRIVKNPDVETKISKIVTTQTITGGKELNKNLESSSKTVTVHRTVQVTSQGDASVNIDKNIDQSNTIHTENIMKGSICIGYPTFEASITENNSEMSNEPTKPHESVENINTESKIVGSEVNKMVLQQSQSNVSETTSNMESNIITKVTTTKLASSFERTTGAKEIVSSKIYSNENNNLVEITEVNPTIERSMTVTRVISSNSNDGQINEKDISKTPTTNKDIHRSITTERNTVEVRSKIPTIERSTTVTRVISSSNDVKVKDVKSEKSSDIKTITTETNLVAIDGNASGINSNLVSETKVVDDPKTPTKENDDIIKNITTVRKVVDIQNTSPTIDRSMTVTLITETNNQKDIEDLKSPSDDKDENIDKTFAKKTIISAISKQMNENRENVKEIVSNKKDERIESHTIVKEKNVVDVTAEKSKVGKLIHRIDSREQTTEITNKHKADEMPKKKSILSKIAMFERHDIEDQMPKKKPENLSKLVIKHPPQKVAHLHTPTIVEEVLKTRENSPLTATSNINIDPLRSEKVTTHDFNINTEIRQVGHGIDSVQGYKDQSFYKSKSFKEYDYKVNADEYKQTVQITKITSNLTIQDNKENNVATTDFVIQELQNTENKTEQNVETSKETVLATSNNNISLVKPDLVATLEYKFEGNIDDQSNQYEEEIISNERKSETVANNNKEYNSGTYELTQASDYKFRGVNRLTSEFERRVEVSNNKKVTAKDYKIDQRPALIATMDYRFDGDVSTRELNKRIETSKQIAEITSNEKQIPNTPEPITTFDYKSKVDIKVQDTEYEQVDKGEENSDIISDRNKVENVGTSETPANEYTFKDVKKLATEYEQKVEFTKNLEVQPRTDTLSPGLLNYESKIFSRSTESLGKVMTDAPVIFITPKTDLQTNSNISKIDDKIEISTTQMKEAVEHKVVENSAIQLEKQISTEYKEAKIYDNKFIERENAHAHIIERSTSLTRHDADSNIFKRSSSLTTATAENRNVTSTTTINTSRFTRSSSNISVGHKEFKEERNVGNFTTTKQSNNTQILDKTIDGSSEIKTVKAKGYVIRREGDLAYARIQEEAEQGDEIRMFDQNPKLPRTPVKETSSTVTRRFKSVEEKKKYYADVDINTVIKGKVSRMISRMTSLEPQEMDKKNIDIKEMPRKMSVLEKIAMFEVSESKAAAGKTEYSFVSRTKIEKAKPQAVNMTQEEFEERVAELKSARLMYGRIENMPNILLRNGVEMPVLALGTAMLDPRLIHHVIGAAIDLGYRAIDTAYIYGNEKEIGEAIRAKIEDGTVRRDELFVISKLWSTFHRTDLVEKACRSSLVAMGLEYFDLYLIHNPMSFKEGGDAIPKIATVVQYSQFDYLDAWYGMEQLMTKGLVRSIGVSNFNSAQLQRILDKGKIKPTVNQVECHPYLSQQKLDVFCEERDIKLSCFGVLGSKGTPAEYKSTLPPVIDDPLVQVMASGLNVSPAQLLIRYQLDSGRNAVVKSSSAKRLWDNLQALTFTLSQGQVEALHALNRNKRTFTFQGMGDTHKNYPFKIAF